MRKVIFNNQDDEVKLADIPDIIAIFAERDGGICGMVTKDEEGWMLLKGGGVNSCGHFDTREELLICASKYNYTFLVV